MPRYRRSSIGPSTHSSPMASPSRGASVPSSATILVRTPATGTPTWPGRRSPSARLLTVMRVSVMP
jgi:hypothetical protein